MMPDLVMPPGANIHGLQQRMLSSCRQRDLPDCFSGDKDVEVGRDRKVIVTVGMDYPEDEDSTLVVGADEMLADEFGDGIECLADGRGFRLWRCGVRCGRRRGLTGNDGSAGGCGLGRAGRMGVVGGVLHERGGFGELGLEDVFLISGFHVRISSLLFLLQGADGFGGQGRSRASMGIEGAEPPGYFGLWA
jgi:hypothetical protein